ncbi:unnamed protein product [Protopolystoma xenopodis]|uniref:Uncharacterized protein n=1 Tax=Protopolystoma xenopodis TaxID=117903 RepID=A0A3S5ALG9_9PLAT|nr:unnamed protein product [Protopolystoma xenopodis]
MRVYRSKDEDSAQQYRNPARGMRLIVAGALVSALKNSIVNKEISFFSYDNFYHKPFLHRNARQSSQLMEDQTLFLNFLFLTPFILSRFDIVFAGVAGRRPCGGSGRFIGLLVPDEHIGEFQSSDQYLTVKLWASKTSLMILYHRIINLV